MEITKVKVVDTVVQVFGVICYSGTENNTLLSTQVTFRSHKRMEEEAN